MLRSALVAFVFAGAVAGTASAQTTPHYSASVIFGDSLSDQGNLADYLGHNFPTPPSYHDSYTNGDVAVAVMNKQLGFTTNPSLFPTAFTDSKKLGLTPGDNYAFAGATAGNTAGVPGANLQSQVGAYLAKTGGVASGNALYTVFIGGNDVRTAAHQNNTSYLTSGIAAELASLQALYTAGARNFLVVNVPDIGKIPEFQLGYPDQVATASADTVLFNNALATGLANLQLTSAGALYTLYNLYDFSNKLTANPGTYGITNTTTPCFTSYTGFTNADSGYTTSGACALNGDPIGNIDHLAYWDAIHPTAAVHKAIGNAMAATVLAVTPVPEPATWLTMVAGFALIGTAMRRRVRVTYAAR